MSDVVCLGLAQPATIREAIRAARDQRVRLYYLSGLEMKGNLGVASAGRNADIVEQERIIEVLHERLAEAESRQAARVA